MNAILSVRHQRGAAAIEFAIVSALFLTTLIAVMEMGRLLWTWNAAVEATRLGARMAVVCDMNDSSIADRMRARLPALATSNITIRYIEPGCTPATCQAVQVSLSGYRHDTVIPFVPVSVTLPPFSTTLRKEFMQSAGNPVCS